MHSAFHRSALAALLASAFITPAAWSQARDDALFSAATAEQPAVVKTLERLVNIETGTGDAEGMAAAGKYFEDELKALGFTVTRSKSAGIVVGDNIVGKLKGKGGKNLLLMSHMDTVYLKGILAKAPFRVEGDKAYGPGIADDKGGNAVILHTLKLLKARGFQDFGTITVLFNTDEEKGSFGSRDLIQEEAKAGDYVLSFEPTARRARRALARHLGHRLRAGQHQGQGLACGRGARAGRQRAGRGLRPGAAHHGHRRQGARTCASTGPSRKAGAVSNIIPDSATLNADVRYARNEDFEAAMKTLEEQAQKKKLPGCRGQGAASRAAARPSTPAKAARSWSTRRWPTTRKPAARSASKSAPAAAPTRPTRRSRASR